MESRLLQETVELLRDAPVSMRVLSEQVGISMRWLYELRNGEIKDPGVRKVETLHRYLTAAQVQQGVGE